MNERKSTEIIEDVINSLEALIDALDDEWHHNDEFEWRQADRIRRDVIPVAKDNFKKHLDEMNAQLDNKMFSLNNLPEEVDEHTRFAVLDNSNPHEPDFFFMPLITLFLIESSHTSSTSLPFKTSTTPLIKLLGVIL